MSRNPTLKELFNLRGKTALVTGASGWLGSAFAEALAEAGANVIAASRKQETADSTAESLCTDQGNKHGGVVLDQLDEASLNSGFDAAVKHTGQVDILVDNGHSFRLNDLYSATADDFADSMKNATGYFLLARRLRDHLVERKAAGNVVMIGSMYGEVASYPDAYEGICPNSAVSYHLLKGGIINMVKHLAVYWAPDRIRVNCLSPGPFPGPAAPPELVERLKLKSPLGRMGQPHELKGALAFLASDASSYLTGHNLVVDGGWTAW